jgi:diguanylate cyclase (GGDEF)-like protein
MEHNTGFMDQKRKESMNSFPISSAEDMRLVVEYMEELEGKDEAKQKEQASRMDELTGVFANDYFEKRMQIVDRSEVVPVAVIEININDWKYANDHYGDEESDRLIRIIADIVREEANPYFVIGRIDGDVFGVLIPMVEEGEAEDYARRIKERCVNYEDEKLAPSVAIGIVYKNNIEQSVQDLFSDAQYEMFEDKLAMKQEPGYRERLEGKGK